MSANHSADDSQRIFFDDEHDKVEPAHEREAKDAFDPHAASPEEKEVQESYGWGV
jgi:hypothetical protein